MRGREQPTGSYRPKVKAVLSGQLTKRLDKTSGKTLKKKREEKKGERGQQRKEPRDGQITALEGGEGREEDLRGGKSKGAI